MGKALGTNEKDEYKDNLHKITDRLRGQRGLMFTNKTKQEVLKYVFIVMILIIRLVLL